MSYIFKAWSSMARRRPVLTLAMTNGLLGGTGDALAQIIEQNNEHTEKYLWDFGRTARFFLWGAACTPIVHKWYMLLNTRIPLPSSRKINSRLFISAVAKRVAADQIVYAPIGIGAFFVAMNFMEGNNWESAKQRLDRYYFPTLVANYAVWPVFQAINFGFIPVMFRIPFSSTISIFWNMFISWTNAQCSSEVDLPIESPHLKNDFAV